MHYQFLDAFAHWLKGTAPSAFIVNSQWIWPTAETLHFIGLAFLVGTVSVLDLRMLGFFKGLRFQGLHRLTRWGIAGFIINLVTGIVFFIGSPLQYLHNVVFQLKLLFMLLAGINALIFELMILPTMINLNAEDDAPATAKVTAFVSLMLWLGVMFFGRMLPFLGEAF